jgi:hypothetical protein
VAALAIAGLSTTKAIAACASCLLCRGLFSRGPTVRVRDRGAWVQQRCSVGRMMCAQLPLDSQFAVRRCDGAGNCLVLATTRQGFTRARNKLTVLFLDLFCI